MGRNAKTVTLLLKIRSRDHARPFLQTTQGRIEPSCLKFPESEENLSSFG